jgi:hypothetical protein
VGASSLEAGLLQQLLIVLAYPGLEAGRGEAATCYTLKNVAFMLGSFFTANRRSKPSLLAS